MGYWNINIFWCLYWTQGSDIWVCRFLKLNWFNSIVEEFCSSNKYSYMNFKLKKFLAGFAVWFNRFFFQGGGTSEHQSGWIAAPPSPFTTTVPPFIRKSGSDFTGRVQHLPSPVLLSRRPLIWYIGQIAPLQHIPYPPSYSLISGKSLHWENFCRKKKKVRFLNSLPSLPYI